MAPVSVVKIGTSSIVRESGELDDDALSKLAGDLASAREAGHEVVLVMSGAIAAGMPMAVTAKTPISVKANTTCP